MKLIKYYFRKFIYCLLKLQMTLLDLWGGSYGFGTLIHLQYQVGDCMSTATDYANTLSDN